MKNKLITSLTLAGTLLAGSVNSLAQQSIAPTPPTTGDRKPGPPAQNATPAPNPDRVVSNTTPVPLPAPSNPTPPTGIVVPISAPVFGDRNLNPGTTPGGNLVAPPAGDAGSGVPRTVPPAARPGASLFTGNAVTTPLPATTTGVTVTAGDIVRGGPAETMIGNGSPVVLLTQQFAEQRTQELTARAAALEQLRTATPEQRAAILADMQATQARLATEQREAARELRNELRSLREERKGN